MKKEKVHGVPKSMYQEKKAESEKANFYEKKPSKVEEDEIFSRNNSSVELIIHLKKPCSAKKFMPDLEQMAKDQKAKIEETKEVDAEKGLNGPGQFGCGSQADRRPCPVRSPFNMTSNLPEDVKLDHFMAQNCTRRKDDEAQVNYETLLNYWNTKQVIRISGIASNEGLDMLIDSVKAANPRVELIDTSSNHGTANTRKKGEIGTLDDRAKQKRLADLKYDSLKFSDLLNKL